MCFMQLIYDNSFHVCMNPLAFVKRRFMHAHTAASICVCAPVCGCQAHQCADKLSYNKVISVKLAQTHTAIITPTLLYQGYLPLPSAVHKVV